jgi:ankyrin repeat protein
MDLQREDGASPMHIAAANGHTVVTKQLIEARCNINLPMQDGSTPLFIAVQNGHAGVANHDNYIGPGGAGKLARVLGQCPALELLDLSYNSIGSVGNRRLYSCCTGTLEVCVDVDSEERCRGRGR